MFAPPPKIGLWFQGLAWIFAALGLLCPLVVAADEVRFNEHIRPILAEHCLECHGPDRSKREADLRLDLESSAKEAVIASGKPDDSEFFQRITSTDPDVRMPPPDVGKDLNAKQIALLRQWIVQGARYEGHWAFEPIQKPTIPPEQEEAKTAIDRILVAALRQRGMTFSAPLTRRNWIRRATFDLTGLPPTWEEVQAFVQDDSPEAFEKVIDRLLSSSAYGQRWGRHWLDIARYADTHGGSAIGFKKFPFSYTYRDYVIRAFNADLPYDRFVTEQLAADQLGLAENDPALAALGFITVGMQFRNPHDTIDDQIDVVTRGLLGLTVACARCHDHKYDAIPTKDYYQLYAAFASSNAPDLLPVIGVPKESAAYKKYQEELASRTVVRDDMIRDQSEVMRGRLRMQVGLYLKELAKGTPEQDLASAFLSYRTDDIRPLVLNRWRDYLAEMDEGDAVFGPWARLAKLQQDGFAEQCASQVEALRKENGDPSKFPDMKSLSAAAPRWNPRVLQALEEKKPKSMLDVADAYGHLFSEVHIEWSRALLEASLEASVGAKVVPDEDARHTVINSPINRQLRRRLYHPGTPTAMPDDLAKTLLNRPIRDRVNGLQGAIHNLHLTSPGSPARAMTVAENPETIEYYVFRRGDPLNRGEHVQARFLTALGGQEGQAFAEGERRLGLARAIIDPNNPLTARVVVNWVWRNHFGRGLVRTPDDFGTRGRPPTHPRLLDYLASTFVEDGWSIKKLHRRIMLTQAYRQGSIENEKWRMLDPDNELLWRMPRRRLDLEAMRDAMLSVSDELDPQLDGRPFDFLAKPIVPRRSVYAFVNRDIVSSLASTFDAANPNACTAKRPETNVPQQTLFALNSEFIQDRAAAFAALPHITSASDAKERIRRMYQRAFLRSPDAEEVQLALDYIQAAGEDGKMKRWQRLAHVLLAANEFVFVD